MICLQIMILEIEHLIEVIILQAQVIIIMIIILNLLQFQILDLVEINGLMLH